MKRGGGKNKGSTFERKVCTALSNWVSAGRDQDLFWRSSMSGGRGTIAKRAGRSIKPIGDICAISPEGHGLTDQFFIECKHYSRLDLDSLIYHRGKLWAFWRHAVDQAEEHGRTPMLIAKQDRYDTILLAPPETFTARSLGIIGDAELYLFDRVLGKKWRRERVII